VLALLFAAANVQVFFELDTSAMGVGGWDSKLITQRTVGFAAFLKI
jgi:hypothetical protein